MDKCELWVAVWEFRGWVVGLLDDWVRLNGGGRVEGRGDM